MRETKLDLWRKTFKNQTFELKIMHVYLLTYNLHGKLANFASLFHVSMSFMRCEVNDHSHTNPEKKWAYVICWNELDIHYNIPFPPWFNVIFSSTRTKETFCQIKPFLKLFPFFSFGKLIGNMYAQQGCQAREQEGQVSATKYIIWDHVEKASKIE